MRSLSPKARRFKDLLGAWEAGTYRAFLRHLLEKMYPRPYATIAAGFLLGQATADLTSAGRLILTAPTWRGPLPTMLGRRAKALGMIANTGDWPMIGPLLYHLNANKATVGMMARGHVYEDRMWLNEFLVVYGAHTPPKSKIEIESLRTVEIAKLVMLPHGKLAIHEEYPIPVVQEIITFPRTPV
jgi:hypothetical protein